MADPRRAIDDATGAVPAAVFRDQEGAAAYLEILRTTLTAQGLPDALYHDRHGAFAPTAPTAPTAPDREPGSPPALSQVDRALVELGIGAQPASMSSSIMGMGPS